MVHSRSVTRSTWSTSRATSSWALAGLAVWTPEQGDCRTAAGSRARLFGGPCPGCGCHLRDLLTLGRDSEPSGGGAPDRPALGSGDLECGVEGQADADDSGGCCTEHFADHGRRRDSSRARQGRSSHPTRPPADSSRLLVGSSKASPWPSSLEVPNRRRLAKPSAFCSTVPRTSRSPSGRELAMRWS